MNCLNCGQPTEVLQTFGNTDLIERIRGHRDQRNCGHRSKTIERYHAFASEGMVEDAQSQVRTLYRLLTQLEEVKEALSRALGMTSLNDILTRLGTDKDIEVEKTFRNFI